MTGVAAASRTKADLNRSGKPRPWSAALIRRLRGMRTQSAFGQVLGVAKNTIWRWEAGVSRPDAERSQRLDDLARSDGFLADWKLVGSMALLGDLDGGRRQVRELFERSLRRTARQLGR